MRRQPAAHRSQRTTAGPPHASARHPAGDNLAAPVAGTPVAVAVVAADPDAARIRRIRPVAADPDPASVAPDIFAIDPDRAAARDATSRVPMIIMRRRRGRAAADANAAMACAEAWPLHADKQSSRRRPAPARQQEDESFSYQGVGLPRQADASIIRLRWRFIPFQFVRRLKSAPSSSSETERCSAEPRAKGRSFFGR